TAEARDHCVCEGIRYRYRRRPASTVEHNGRDRFAYFETMLDAGKAVLVAGSLLELLHPCGPRPDRDGDVPSAQGEGAASVLLGCHVRKDLTHLGQQLSGDRVILQDEF